MSEWVLTPIEQKLQAAGVRIFRIRGWAHKSGRRGASERVWYYDEFVVIDEETAKRMFKAAVDELKTWEGIRGMSGKVQLCEPHIFESGLFAYWSNAGYAQEYELGQPRNSEKGGC